MGTWGAGPFDNDSAEELADDLAAETRGRRAESLYKLFSASIEQAQDADPSEVVAAAVIVAASRPGTPISHEYPAVASWLEVAAAVDLSGLAAQALHTCLPEGGWYWQSWTREQDRSDAHDLFVKLVAALDRSSSSSQ
ncbi:DUF4259 domain-containing protein [Promicromonospora sp. NPDC052451]|uniref:DUF4259 domain-containing protein n=1 Tax=Promicromonospora sp. NPDC052451 TaxID=3364407 RepID=UPI0037CC6334